MDCHHSEAVLLCGAVQNCDSEPKIHLAREEKGGRKKDRDTRDEEARRMVMVEGCRAIVEGAVWRSVLRCALLCPLLCIIPSMNISLITAEKAKWSRGEERRGRVSHCSVYSHRAFPPPLDIPMPHISMSPALQASTSLLFLSLCTPFSYHAKFFSALFFSSLSALPVSNITFTYVTMSFILSPSLSHNPLFPPLLTLDG